MKRTLTLAGRRLSSGKISIAGTTASKLPHPDLISISVAVL